MLRSLVCYVASVAGIVGSLFYAGPVTQIVFGHDLFSLMEGGWKMDNGNLPYIDFQTLMGPLPHLMIAFGIALTGPNPAAFPVSIALTAIPLAVLAWHLISRRFGPATSFFLSLYLVLLWVGPYPLHFDSRETSYAMMYNRESYAFLILVMLVLFGKRHQDAYWVGLLLGLLLFFKLPFFIAGMGFVALRPAWIGYSKEAAWLALTGFLTIALPMTIYLRGSVGLGAMIQTVLDAARIRTPDILQDSLALVKMEFPFLTWLLALTVVCLILLWKKPADSKNKTIPPPGWLELVIETSAVLAIALFIELSGCPLGYLTDVPLINAYALVLLDRLAQIKRGNQNLQGRVCLVVATLACSYIVVPAWLRPLNSIYEVVQEKDNPLKLPGDTVLDSPRFHLIRFYGTCGQYPSGITWATKINDGLALIRKHSELDKAVIASLDYADAFSLPLGKISPPHMPLGIQYGFNVNETTWPDPERIFTGCDAIMVPVYPDSTENAVVILKEKYAGFLSTHFTAIDQTPLWTLYVRKKS